MSLRSMIIFLAGICTGILLLIGFSGPILTSIGGFPVVDDSENRADAVVVLFTGVDYYPRLLEAARIYNAGKANTVVINGNRKSDVLRTIERKGFSPSCHWADRYVRILELYGVPKTAILAISAEDAFDTISEAQVVGQALLGRGIRKIMLTTSKFHTRRARHIWRTLFKGQLVISAAAATLDPYTPDGWWKEGRQIRWVMAEYGAWGYYLWQSLIGAL